MKCYIEGIGIISRCACQSEQLLEIAKGEKPVLKPLPLEFPIDIPPAKLRRNSRYNKMACAAADQSLKEIKLPECHRIGTIVSTGYGAAEYSSLFADSVVKGDASACSPSIFSGSVPNSCLGQICIINGLKGFSTVLAGGDPLEYAALLLETGRADMVLAGSVEEYFPPLYDSLQSFEAAKGSDLSEGAAMLVLSRTRTEKSYCELGGFSGLYLGSCPYIHKMEGPDLMKGLKCRIMEQLRKLPVPDFIFSAANGTWFDAVEQEVLTNVFPGIPQIHPKDWFGETMGCGYLMSVSLAAAGIRNNNYTSVLVTGVDMIGNYSCIYLSQM